MDTWVKARRVDVYANIQGRLEMHRHLCDQLAFTAANIDHTSEPTRRNALDHEIDKIHAASMGSAAADGQYRRLDVDHTTPELY